MHQCREVFVPQKMMFRSLWLVSRNKQDHLHKEIFVLRQHGHPEREREADPGPDLESDRPLPARRQQLPAQEAHARLTQGEHVLIFLFYVNMAMMVTMLIVAMVVWVSRLEGNQASSPTLNPHRLAMTRDILLLTLFVFIWEMRCNRQSSRWREHTFSTRLQHLEDFLGEEDRAQLPFWSICLHGCLLWRLWRVLCRSVLMLKKLLALGRRWHILHHAMNSNHSYFGSSSCFSLKIFGLCNVSTQSPMEVPRIFMRCWEHEKVSGQAGQYNLTDLCDVFNTAINLLCAVADNS